MTSLAESAPVCERCRSLLSELFLKEINAGMLQGWIDEIGRYVNQHIPIIYCGEHTTTPSVGFEDVSRAVRSLLGKLSWFEGVYPQVLYRADKAEDELLVTKVALEQSRRNEEVMRVHLQRIDTRRRSRRR